MRAPTAFDDHHLLMRRLVYLELRFHSETVIETMTVFVEFPLTPDG